PAGGTIPTCTFIGLPRDALGRGRVRWESMKTLFTLSRPVLPVGTSSKVDLLVSFRADAASSKRRGLNLSVVIDRSGSMAGAPLKHALQASRNLVERMGPEDWVSIVAYDDTPLTVLEPQKVQDRAAIEKAFSRV